MTIQEIRDAFWKLIGQIEGSYDNKLTSAQADELIWRGFFELWKRAKPVDMRATATITVDSTGDNEYPLPDDFFSYNAQEPFSVAGVPLKKTTKGQLNRRRPGWTDETGTGADRPVAYYEIGRPTTGTNEGKRCVAFFPHFDADVTCDYLRKPRKFSDFADGDEYDDVPEEYHLAGPHWANWMFFRGNSERASNDPGLSKDFFEEQASFMVELSEEENQPDLDPEIEPTFQSKVDGYWMGFDC